MEENVKVVEANQKEKKVNKKKKNKNKKAEKKNFKNPYKTTWGKILVWVLCISMALGTVASLIYLIIQNFFLNV